MNTTTRFFWRYLPALAATLLASAVGSYAQTLDPAFERTHVSLPVMTDNVAEQADGRLILSAGPGIYYRGQQVRNILRLNLNGTPDLTFGSTWLQAGGAARALRVLPNGKILLVGESFSITETLGGLDLATRTGVVVLNTNGTLDRTYRFAEAGGAWSGDVQPDGKILVGGSFTVFNGAPVGRLVRLLSTGQPDPTFTAGFNGTVRSVLVLPNGNILVGGDFTAYGTTPAVHVARLLPDGSLDTTFNAQLRAADLFQNFAVQPDGKVVFVNINTGVFPLVGLVHRLLTNGSPDASFVSGAIHYLALNQTGDHTVTVQPDGGVLVAGSFDQYNGQPSSGLVRLLPTGAIDPNAPMGTDFGGVLTAICSLHNGQALACGRFTMFNNRPTGLVKLSATGQIDPSFGLQIGTQGTISTSLRLSNGSVLVGGSFSSINGVGAANLALLGTDGHVDTTYTRALPPLNSDVLALAPGPQGTVYVGGAFFENGNAARRCLLRLRADGSQDPTFTAPSLTGAVSALATYPNQRLLVGGGFGGTTPELFRLTAQGTMDPTFSGSFGTYVPYLSAMVLQRDERIAALTSTTSWQFNPQGTLTGTSNTVPRFLHALAVQPDGRILVGGEFSSFAGGTRGSLARLVPSGALDPSFDAGTIFMQNNIPAVKALAVQDDGRILIGGYFTSINNQAHRSLARLLADGQVDNSFADTAPVHPEVAFLAIHPNGRLLVGSSALDGQTQQFLTEGLTCLQVPGLTGPAPSGTLSANNPGSGSTQPVLFPVPASSNATIQAPTATTRLAVTVYNMLGVEVYQASTVGNVLQLPVASLAEAAYVVRIVSNNTDTTYRRLVVKH